MAAGCPWEKAQRFIRVLSGSIVYCVLIVSCRHDVRGHMRDEG